MERLTEAEEERLAKAAADARLPYVQAHKANINRLTVLAADADEKLREVNEESTSYVYWSGWQDGINRARMILEGRG